MLREAVAFAVLCVYPNSARGAFMNAVCARPPELPMTAPLCTSMPQHFLEQQQIRSKKERLVAYPLDRGDSPEGGPGASNEQTHFGMQCLESRNWMKEGKIGRGSGTPVF